MQGGERVRAAMGAGGSERNGGRYHSRALSVLSIRSVPGRLVDLGVFGFQISPKAQSTGCIVTLGTDASRTMQVFAGT